MVALAYHGVAEVSDADDPDGLVLAPELFASQLRLLRRLRRATPTAAELADRHPPGSRPRGRATVLTFDDGLRDNLDNVVPMLAAIGMRGSFYVCPGMLGGQHPGVRGEAGRLLDADGVRAIAEAGMEVGSHTRSHPDLRGLDDGALARELEGSKRDLEDLLGRPCRTLAYPFGLHDARVEAAAARAGYELAWSWLPGRWDPMAAPRTVAPPRHGAGRLAAKLLGLRRPGR